MTPRAGFAEAVADAPAAPGVYFFLGAGSRLLYIGKAGHLRRRLQQHAKASALGGNHRTAVMYERVRDIRWEELPDEDVAAAREADLIVALSPQFNASYTIDGRWAYIEVGDVGGAGRVGAGARAKVRFTLTTVADLPAPRAARFYGCFPHLGRGVSSRPAIACSDGYTAFLRLLWAATRTRDDHYPRSIAGPSPPPTFETGFDAPPTALHAFLSGTSNRLLRQLAAAGRDRPAYMQPALRRDLHAAERFFTNGPRAIRNLRLRHGVPPGPVTRATITHLFATEARDVIGEFRYPAADDATANLIGARTARVRTIGAAMRNARL